MAHHRQKYSSGSLALRNGHAKRPILKTRFSFVAHIKMLDLAVHAAALSSGLCYCCTTMLRCGDR